jgi:hypothetical protein
MIYYTLLTKNKRGVFRPVQYTFMENNEIIPWLLANARSGREFRIVSGERPCKVLFEFTWP